MNGVHYIVNDVHCTLYSVQYTVNSVNCAIYSEQGTKYCEYGSPHSEYCIFIFTAYVH